MCAQPRILDTISDALSRELQNEIDRKMMHSLDQERFFDEVQAHIIVAGGGKIPTQTLKNMRVEDLVKMLWPNSINLVVKNKRLQDNQ